MTVNVSLSMTVCWKQSFCRVAPLPQSPEASRPNMRRLSEIPAENTPSPPSSAYIFENTHPILSFPSRTRSCRCPCATLRSLAAWAGRPWTGAGTGGAGRACPARPGSCGDSSPWPPRLPESRPPRIANLSEHGATPRPYKSQPGYGQSNNAQRLAKPVVRNRKRKLPVATEFASLSMKWLNLLRH